MLRILLCDDDLSYQEILSYKIRAVLEDKLQMQASIHCVKDLDAALQYIYENPTDIFFLDVMLQEENAINRLMQLQNDLHNLPCILMTAFPVETYNLSEIDCCYYFIKSRLTDDQLLRALKRAINFSAKKDPNIELVRIGSENYAVNFQNLLYIETFNNNLMLHLSDGESMTIYCTLKKFSQKLPPNFLRCHKSFMVNMNHIHGFSPHCFTLSSGAQIPIPPKKYGEIVQIYRNYLLKL
ncbi:MAG: LytR/AlgR family response regulator transcription factor [Acutalibacteraceae bacterium]